MRYRRRGDGDAMPGEVHWIGDDQSHIAIESAGEDVLAGAGGELGVPGVVHADGERVGAGGEGIGDLDAEAGVAPFVPADVCAVDEDMGDLERTFKFEELPLADPVEGDIDLFSVPPLANIELGCAEVGQIERVRQSHRRPLRIVERREVRSGSLAEVEFPVAVEGDGLAGRRVGGHRVFQIRRR